MMGLVRFLIKNQVHLLLLHLYLLDEEEVEEVFQEQAAPYPLKSLCLNLTFRKGLPRLLFQMASKLWGLELPRNC